MSGGKRRLPNLPQLLPIWAVAIFPTERQNERVGATAEEKGRKDNMAFSTCCSFKWVLPACRAGPIIQLPGCPHPSEAWQISTLA